MRRIFISCGVRLRKWRRTADDSWSQFLPPCLQSSTLQLHLFGDVDLRTPIAVLCPPTSISCRETPQSLAIVVAGHGIHSPYHAHPKLVPAQHGKTCLFSLLLQHRAVERRGGGKQSFRIQNKRRLRISFSSWSKNKPNPATDLALSANALSSALALLHIGNKRDVNKCKVIVSHTELELAHRLNEGGGFDITHSSAKLMKG